MPVIPGVTYTTPDGVERLLRWTLGAQRRTGEYFGSVELTQILNKYSFGALPRLIYYCLFDEQGKPPAGIPSAEAFEESFPGDPEVGQAALVAFMSAVTQGKIPKDSLEATLAAEMKKLQNGSSSGVSAGNASGSPTASSGISTPPNSTPSPSATPPPNGSPTTAPES